MGDALGLALVFGGSALLALVYYRLVPARAALFARLPNRVSLASIILTLIIGGWVWWAWHTVAGFGRIGFIIGTLFNLLVFETFFLVLLRFFRSNTLSILLAAAVTGGVIWLQRNIDGNWVFNATFILATLGAATLLIRLEFLRTKFLAMVAGLWMVYDILSVLFIYPQIYRVAERPNVSFFFPAVAFGQVTLGSGDFMFLVLMTLVLLRDRGLRWALTHIGLQALGLVIAILVKPRDSLWPYLTVMVPLFLAMWYFSRPGPVADKSNNSGVDLTSR